MNAPLTNLDMETEKIMMFFSATHLPHMKGTTDAFAFVYLRNNFTGALQSLGNTETVMDNCHPSWTTHITADYQFEQIQEIVVRVWHKSPHAPVNEQTTAPGNSVHTYLGEISFTESALMMVQGCKMSIPLRGGVMGGKVTIRGESVAQTRDVFTCAFQCEGLPRKNGWGVFAKSDPYIQISRKYEDGTYSPVWKSPHIPNTITPVWNANRIHMMPLCNGDVSRELSIDLFDYDPSGNHKPMGSFRCTVRELLESNGKAFTLIEQAKQGSFMYSNSGTLRCINAKVEHHPTLGQYIMGGLSISLLVCIDFTASNGDPNSGRSLHRIGRAGEPMNDYEKAITSIGQVIEAYSTTKQFGVYGFGAKIKQPDGSLTPTQHCFPIYGGQSLVNGTNGVIQAYHDAVSVVSLSGPTNFQPLVDNAGYLASSTGCTQDNQNYVVMVILTDGVIDDKNETIQSIIRAANTPLSIIIVGIGNEDFSDMSHLDSDGKLLEQGGATACRDIVQFVPFKKFLQKGPVALAQSVLAEIPSQVLKFMEMRGIKPKDMSPPPAFMDDSDEPNVPPPTSSNSNSGSVTSSGTDFNSLLRSGNEKW